MRSFWKWVAVALAGVFVPGTAPAAPVYTYNDNVGNWAGVVGAGQFDGYFAVARDANFFGGPIQLGLRAVQRQNTPGITAIAHPMQPGIDNLYVVQPGAQLSPPTTPPGNRAWWNFDIAVDYANTANLDSLTLSIERLSGNVPTPNAASFDLLALAGILDVTGANPALYRASQNPVFAPWFTNYLGDPTATGLYRFTLTATEGGQSISTSMLVNVGNEIQAIPEPGTLALFGGLLVGGGFALRRRRRPA